MMLGFVLLHNFEVIIFALDVGSQFKFFSVLLFIIKLFNVLKLNGETRNIFNYEAIVEQIAFIV